MINKEVGNVNIVALFIYKIDFIKCFGMYGGINVKQIYVHIRGNTLRARFLQGCTASTL